ncbi:hypothetical protein Scel_09310 [Streptomyces cellostaticus]|nr:hypothetical protein Scel_09310 [Streptomyces cellostaticus]
MRTAASQAATPIGRLIRKIQCQFRAWVGAPPRKVPSAPPAAPTALNTAMARACSRGSGKSATSMPRTTAEAIAPPTSCRARAAISTPCPVAVPHSTEAAVNTASPEVNQ